MNVIVADKGCCLHQDRGRRGFMVSGILWGRGEERAGGHEKGKNDMPRIRAGKANATRCDWAEATNQIITICMCEISYYYARILLAETPDIEAFWMLSTERLLMKQVCFFWSPRVMRLFAY